MSTTFKDFKFFLTDSILARQSLVPDMGIIALVVLVFIYA